MSSDNMYPPRVGVLLGSASDMPLARKAAEIFDALKIPYEVGIASAHRTPEDVRSYAQKAHGRGIRVIIAVAGLSAALPGVVAAHTPLPVIGVPVSGSTLGGMEALLSITQMPPGVPVASVGMDGAKNAALLATRILALTDPLVMERLQIWIACAAAEVASSRKKLAELPAVPDDAYQEDE